MPLRIAVAGCGWATRNLHLPALARTSVGQIVAAADPNAPLPGLPSQSQFQTVAEMLRAVPADAILIASPPADHAETGIAALEAGLHVLVEKPVALHPEDARRMADAAAAAHRIIAAGFNQRCHPQFARLKKRIATGQLGQLESIHVRWHTTSGLGARPWIGDRALGGGALFDLGSHVIDLWRFLTGADLAELTAQTSHQIVDDETIVLEARLANNVRARADLSLIAGEHYSVEIRGSKATARIHPYGRDFARSYDAQWLQFAAAIHGETNPAASIEDGLRSLEWVHQIARANPLPPRPPILPTQFPLSAICATPTNFDAIRTTVSHLRRQSIVNQIELVLVGPSEQSLQAPAAELAGFAHVERVAAGELSSIARANAAGIRLARGQVVALTEDHCFPEPAWAAALIAAHRENCSVAGPIVRNGNPATAVSRADFAIGYGPWMEPATRGPRPFLPGHNSSYKRLELLALGGRLEHLMESETVLHMEWSSQGRTLLLEPAARVRHMNYSLWRSWIPVQILAGRVFGGARAASWPRRRQLFFAAASPLIPAVRLFRCLREFQRPGRRPAAYLSAIPALALGLVLDGFGQFLGYFLGPGDAAQRLARYEYNRIDHVQSNERNLWTSP